MKLVDMMKVEYWHLGIIRLDTSSAGFVNTLKKAKIEWFDYKYPDRFYADPFLLSKNENMIQVLAEEYFHDERKGRIVKLSINLHTLKIQKIETMIDEKTHLSFPQVYHNEICPENYRSNAYYSYHFENNKPRKRLIFNKPCIDPILFQYQNTEYLFTSLPEASFADEMLYFKKGEEWILHPMSPIQTSKRYARMAGNIFMADNVLYRPVQDCESTYGSKVHLMKIIKLSPSEYEEELCNSIDSHSCRRFNMGLHTFNYCGDFVLIDGYSFRVHVLRRLLITAKRRLCKRK